MKNKEIKISEPQKNSLQTALVIFNKTIDEMEYLCMSEKKEGILYYYINNFTDIERNQILNKFRQMKKYLEYLNKKLNFHKERNEIKHHIRSHISSLWEIVCGIESKRLASYGVVDISLKKNLDPAVHKLIKLLNETMDILNK